MDLYKAVKNPKSKTKSTSEPTPVLFSMGYIDLIFKIKLTDKDLFKTEELQKKEENPENEEEKENTPADRYYHIEDLNNIEDLKFLKDKKELWDKIGLSGGNDTLKQILIGNRISKKRCNIEYFAYNRPTFTDNEEFFNEIFDHVCKKHHLYINKEPLEDSARFTLKIILQHKGEFNTISIGKSFEEVEKERIIKKRRKQKREQIRLEQMNNFNNITEQENQEKEKEEEEKKNESEYRKRKRNNKKKQE